MNDENIKVPVREIMRRMEELAATARCVHIDWGDVCASGSMSLNNPIIQTDYSSRSCQVTEAIMTDDACNFRVTGNVWEIYSDDSAFFGVHIYNAGTKHTGCWLAIEQPDT